MLYLDVEVLNEAISRVDTKLRSMNRNLESPEASILIALVYERLIRGEAPSGFFELFSKHHEGGRV